MTSTPNEGQESSIRVFIVEDQAHLLRTLKKFLGTCKEIEVVGCSLSGEDALEEIPKAAPQVVLLDLELPGMNGLQVLRTLKPAHPNIEFLILTTFDDETRVYDAVKSGAAGYLVKRIAHKQIVQAIEDVWAGGTVIEPRIARRFWNYFESVKRSDARAADHGLSDTEIDILQFLAKGLSNSEVGRVMSIQRRAVRSHLCHIYRKLDASNHVEAVVKALGLGIINL